MTAEQVTERLMSIGQQLIDRLRSLPLKSVHNAICALLILWLLIVIAQFVWALLPSDVDSAKDTETVAAAAQSTAKQVDLQKLQSSHLFGEAGAVTPQQLVKTSVANDVELNAKKTQLNLLLEGIVHTPDAKDSVAVIVYQGKQDQYYVGDKLPVSNKVTLAKVLMDHVILDNAGSYESLWLYDDEKRSVVKRRAPTPAISRGNKVTDKRNDVNATDLASGYRKKLYNNPSSLAQVLRISPAQKDGAMVGYRVSPGRDRAQFTELGFKTNDVVTSVNGIDLDDPSKALEIYKLMRTAKEASFTVDRNGESIDVMVSLGE